METRRTDTNSLPVVVSSSRRTVKVKKFFDETHYSSPKSDSCSERKPSEVATKQSKSSISKNYKKGVHKVKGTVVNNKNLESEIEIDLPDVSNVSRRKKTYPKKKAESLLNNSNSFEEYGLLLPSYDDILKNIDKVKVMGKSLDTFDELYSELDKSLPEPLKNIIKSDDDELEDRKKLLDCKSLSTNELQTYFHEVLPYLKDIFEGKVFSERHNKFQQHEPNFFFTLNDLTYNSSALLFTDNQVDYLIKMLEETLDPDDQHSEYFFKVLLPELCFKIFGMHHNMTEEEAKKYLDWVPVE